MSDGRTFDSLRSADRWAELTRQAGELSDERLAHYASASLGANHSCVDCFTCACCAERDRRLSVDAAARRARRSGL